MLNDLGCEECLPRAGYTKVSLPGRLHAQGKQLTRTLQPHDYGRGSLVPLTEFLVIQQPFASAGHSGSIHTHMMLAVLHRRDPR